MIYEYEIVLKFEVDRKLTEREKDDLQALVSLQALEPTSLAGEDEEYRTSAVYVDIIKEDIWYSPTSKKEGENK